MRAVVWTDVFQAGVMGAGLITIVILVMYIYILKSNNCI